MTDDALPAAVMGARAPRPPAISPAIAEPVAARLVAAALSLGVLAQVLFVGQDGGINVLLATLALLVAARLVRPPRARLDRTDGWIPAAAVTVAAFVALRADPALLFADTVAALVLAGASVAAIAGVPVTRMSTASILRLAVVVLGHAAIAAERLVPSVPLLAARLGGGRGGSARPILRGLLVATPIVLLFVLLFATADAVFARVVGDLFAPRDAVDVAFRLLFAAVAAWLAAGVLVYANAPHVPIARPASGRPHFGTLEALVVLIAVDLVFALFVALQAAYLFGGQDTLAATGMSHSTYARRGFFELVAVAVLAGGLIATLEAVVRHRSRAYVTASVALAALTGVVLVSAAVRLGLYQQAYGWTELRFYVLAAICWLGICIALAIAFLATARGRWLVHGVVIAGVGVTIAVNAVGPQAFVAARNVERVMAGVRAPDRDGYEETFDPEYLGSLGDDVVPVLLEALPSLPPAERSRVRELLRDRLDDLDRADGRALPSWNLSRERARALLDAARVDLGAVAESE